MKLFSVIPELNDEFVKSLAIENVSTVSEYRQYLYKQILEYKTTKAKEQTAMKVSIALMQANPMKIPAALIEQYIDNQLARISKQAEAYQMPLEVLLKYSGFNSVEEFKKRYSLIARDHLHEQYILRAVIMKEKISVSKAELDAHYELIASANQTTVEEINAVLKNNVNETLNYTDDPIVSSDVIGATCGSLVDGLSTSVLDVEGKQLVKVVAWYDNEMSYSAQMVRTAKYLMEK